VFDVADGLWGWTRDHPEWHPGCDWEPSVSSFCVTSAGVTLLMDALEPEDPAVWRRLDALDPTAVVYLKPDHVRDVRLFCDRYGATAYGEWDAHEELVPDLAPFEPTAPGWDLPGGVRLLDDGRWRRETPAYLPEQRALVFADGVMCDPAGTLRVWNTPWHTRRVVGTIRALLAEHDVEHVLVSHGAPAHRRDELVAALDRDPWTG
jgi:hypothetical protein